MRSRAWRWLRALAIALALGGTFAWYFLGLVPFDLVRWWATCLPF
jgi:hypothetical protein